jgi:hypothetical protein
MHLICSLFVAKFIVPGWGHKINSGIGLSYRPARLHTDLKKKKFLIIYKEFHRLAGRVKPYAGVNYIPQSGTMK